MITRLRRLNRRYENTIVPQRWPLSLHHRLHHWCVGELQRSCSPRFGQQRRDEASQKIPRIGMSIGLPSWTTIFFLARRWTDITGSCRERHDPSRTHGRPVILIIARSLDRAACRGHTFSTTIRNFISDQLSV